VNKAAQGSANVLEAEGSKFGGRTLPWSRSSSIRRLILHAQSGITPTFAALARSGAGLLVLGQQAVPRALMADEEAGRLLLRRFGCRLSGMRRDQACARERRRRREVELEERVGIIAQGGT
jgi:hypothetical protein